MSDTQQTLGHPVQRARAKSPASCAYGLSFWTLVSDVRVLAWRQPILLLGVLGSLGYGTALVFIGVFTPSIYVGIYGVYSVLFAVTKYLSLRRLGQQDSLGRADAAWSATLLFLLFTLAILSTFFYEVQPSRLGLWSLIVIAVVAVFRLVVATIGSVRARIGTGRSLVIHQVRVMDVANALVAIGLAHKAIFYHLGNEYVSTAGVIGGVYSRTAAVVLAFMVVLNIGRAIRSGAIPSVQPKPRPPWVRMAVMLSAVVAGSFGLHNFLLRRPIKGFLWFVFGGGSTITAIASHSSVSMVGGSIMLFTVVMFGLWAWALVEGFLVLTRRSKYDGIGAMLP